MKRIRFSAALLVCLVGACASDKPGSIQVPDLSADAGPSDKLICASETCKLPAGMKGVLCCVDPFAGGCGIKGDDSCLAIPKADPTCPAPDMPSGGDMSAASSGGSDEFSGFFVQCCASDNQCGIDYGMGCTDVATLCKILPKNLAKTIHPATCNGTPMALPDDCGMDFNLPGLGGSGD